ncbi:MAG: trimethylamine methyltransferase family protein, partial [Thermoproteota archaeon]
LCLKAYNLSGVLIHVRGLRTAPIQVLTENEVQELHEASLNILWKVGFSFPHERILSIFSKAGAEVDWAKNTVRIPRHLVEEAITRVPKTYEVKSPSGTNSIMINDHQIKGVMATGIMYIDYAEEKVRYGSKEDVLKGIACGSALENVAYISPWVWPTADIPGPLHDVEAFRLLYTYSPKPCGCWIFTAKTARHILKMAEIVAGGKEELMRKKLLGYTVDVISPLRVRRESLEILLMFSDYGLPVGFNAFPMAGLNGPATLAGNLSLANAEMLAGTTLIYLLNKKQPIGYPFTGSPAIFDLKVGEKSDGCPERILMALAYAQLSRSYGVVPQHTVNTTDSLFPDFQRGYENTLHALPMILAGFESVGMGVVRPEWLSNLELLVIDDEWISSLNRFVSGFEVNEDTLGLDTIMKVGIGGSFLTEKHTLEHMRREFWYPRLFNRLKWDYWVKRGRKKLLDLAREEVQRIIREIYPPQPLLDKSTIKELEKITEEARKDVLG